MRGRCRICNPLLVEAGDCVCPYGKPRYYVYALCLGDGTMFYVGKGSRLRFKEHEKRATSVDSLVSRKIRKLRLFSREVKHLIIARTDDEELAFLIEQLVVAQFPPRFLCNRTKGGDGVRGYVPSDEVRRRTSERMKGNKIGKGWGYTTAESRKRIDWKAVNQKTLATKRARGIRIGNLGHNRGFRHSPESIERMRIAQSNRKPISEDARKKMSLSHIGNKSATGKKKSEW